MAVGREQIHHREREQRLGELIWQFCLLGFLLSEQATCSPLNSSPTPTNGHLIRASAINTDALNLIRNFTYSTLRLHH